MCLARIGRCGAGCRWSRISLSKHLNKLLCFKAGMDTLDTIVSCDDVSMYDAFKARLKIKRLDTEITTLIYQNREDKDSLLSKVSELQMERSTYERVVYFYEEKIAEIGRRENEILKKVEAWASPFLFGYIGYYVGAKWGYWEGGEILGDGAKGIFSTYVSVRLATGNSSRDAKMAWSLVLPVLSTVYKYTPIFDPLFQWDYATQHTTDILAVWLGWATMWAGVKYFAAKQKAREMSPEGVEGPVSPV